MPRGGGGGFRGGGFSGGGFSGGFRGSSFRGSAGSFRVGSIRSSGRPFGRTGASRTVSRPSTGPYRHNYYRPRSHYWGHYGHYYRPWYWRWWHYPRFWGYHHRPWYYSPVYLGGSLILLIVLPLIILPLLGVAFYYPFGGGVGADGTVNYRSTVTLGFNEFSYEYEPIDAGSTITFSFLSNPDGIPWAIHDTPFEDLPITTRYGQFLENTTVSGNEGYEYILLFLRPGSSINYTFTATANIDFFIADTEDMISWNNWGSPVFLKHLYDVTVGTGDLDITTSMGAQDFYVVWYNDEATPIDVNFDVQFKDEDVPNLAAAYESGLTDDSGTFDVPHDGDWYFFIYFDPMYSSNENIDITFDVTYELGAEGNLAAWGGARGWLIFFGVVAAVLIVMAVFNRRKQKEFKTTASDTPNAQTQSQTVVVQQSTATTPKCPRCHSPMKASDIYCNSCGEKREGRRVGEHTTTDRRGNCDYCGAKLLGNSKFCTSCGSRIE
ncbi:MAG: hypothetical protein ACTSRE_02485 [Promethearchaeota archaeon]